MEKEKKVKEKNKKQQKRGPKAFVYPWKRITVVVSTLTQPMSFSLQAS